MLTLEEWRARYVRYCPTCECDTLPLGNGRCAWCETKILTWDALPDAPPPATVGFCRMCGTEFESNRPKEFCTETCRKRFWRNYTVSGQAATARKYVSDYAKKKAKRAANIAAGLLADGGERRAA